MFDKCIATTEKFLVCSVWAGHFYVHDRITALLTVVQFTVLRGSFLFS